MCASSILRIVLRANRVVDIGARIVSGVIGKSVHLRPASGVLRCDLRGRARLRRHSSAAERFPQEFEVYTSDSDRTLQYVLRPMAPARHGGSAQDDAMCWWSPMVSALRRAQRALENLNLGLGVARAASHPRAVTIPTANCA